MDKIIYSTSEAVCQGLSSVGLNQFAYDIGFKGENILGQPAVFCAAQGSGSYWVGLILLATALYGLVAVIGRARKAKSE